MPLSHLSTPDGRMSHAFSLFWLDLFVVNEYICTLYSENAQVCPTYFDWLLIRYFRFSGFDKQYPH